MIGRRLLHYEIVEKVGEGGMGVVYKARDTHLDRFVAIKVLPPEKVSDPARKARFVQEAKAASALNHPNIIHTYDIAGDAGVDFIAMEFVDGKTLDQLIPRNGMRLNEALKIAIQISDALACAHAAGIIHRDLKPANIMVDSHGHVKVLDFGLAKLTEASTDGQTVTMKTEEGAILGTAAYMAPEQAEGRPVDARSDIFGFGAVLYEILTGRRAFHGESRLSTLSAVLHQEPKPMADVPNDLKRITNHCLRKDPERRFQHMQDLKVELEELKEESDSGRLVPASASSANRGRWIWAAAAGVAAVVLAGWWGLNYRGRSSPPPALGQLTAYPGSEAYPTFSPDGKQVAFMWGGEKSDNPDIYVKLVGETNALRLTTDPAPESWPAWSPDGSRIAFQRDRPGTPGIIWSISPLGGAEQKLSELNAMGQISWSPDGKWLAMAQGIALDNPGDLRGIFLVPAEGGEPRRITNPKAPGFDIHPAISADGRFLAYTACSSRWSCDLYVQQLGAGYVPHASPQRLTRQGFVPAGLAWSLDGRSLIYSASVLGRRAHYLWQVGFPAGEPPQRLDLAGFLAVHPSIARSGNRLAFSRDLRNLDIWRYRTGGTPEPFLMSSLHEFLPAFSPDGSKIAFVSNRSGESFEIWVANADGSQPVPLTNRVGRYQSSHSWSYDGRWIAFESQGQDGHWDIFVIDATGGRPRRLTSEPSDECIPQWSHDGQSIYFFSNRTGREEIFRMASAGGRAEQLTRNGGYLASESDDGKTLFYNKGYYTPLFAMPLAAGPERQVLDHVSELSFVVTPDGIYYFGRRGDDRQYPLQFFQFSTGVSRLITRIGGTLDFGLTISPDRKTILFTNSATWGSDLMLIENFR